MKHIFSLILLLCATAMSAQTDITGMTAALTLDHVQVLRTSSSNGEGNEGRWAIVTREAEPTILAFGEGALDMEHISPEFLYMVESYEACAAKEGTSAFRAPRRRAESFTNISTLVSTRWEQGSPYYNKCPNRCVTGCVATAMAQVLNFHKLPKTMRGTKTYGYTNDAGNRATASFDFGATTIDWNNMQNSYSIFSSNAAKEAVATLMYACGVAASMRYGTNESGANTWVGADGINCFMNGVRAEYSTFNTDEVLKELKAGRPVIYSGAKSNNGGHCFVIDGARQDGYLHCNMGWGGSSDGYYLPTDMAGYTEHQDMVKVYPSDEVPTYTPMEELLQKKATASSTPATTVEPNKWYALWNEGRAGSPMSNGVGKDITNTSMLPCGDATIYNAPQLVRLVPTASGSSFYIETGLGDYWGSFSVWGGSGKSTRTKDATFTVGAIQEGYFWIRSGSTCFLDTNGPGSTVVGWNPSAPTDIYSNSSWRFYPITLTDDNSTPKPEELPVFDATKNYTLRNTGYSQGYLVAISASDEHPTLRGVTQDHANGLYEGAAYHDAPDLSADGAHWRILTEGTKQYLVNVGTGKYLTNSGDRTSYVFSTTKSAINIAKNADGTYTFNAGTDAQSFLCAATQMANPAAFWEATDAGSVWAVELASDPDPEPPGPTPETKTYRIRLASSALYFTTNEVVDNDPVTTYSLSAEPEDFVLTPVAGVTNGFQITSTNGKQVGHTVANSWDFSDDASTWVIEHVDGTPTSILKQGFSVGFGADVEEDGRGVFTDKSGQLWQILENVTTAVSSTHPLREEATTSVYMIDGRALQAPLKSVGGLYIVNGRKYLKR